MDTTAIKGRLHEYIEQADDRHLEAMYVLLEKEIAPSHQYDAATLEMLYERREKHLKGLTKSYTAEEAIASVRNARINKDMSYSLILTEEARINMQDAYLL